MLVNTFLENYYTKIIKYCHSSFPKIIRYIIKTIQTNPKLQFEIVEQFDKPHALDKVLENIKKQQFLLVQLLWSLFMLRIMKEMF